MADLSAPNGSSVNDGILSKLSSLSYLLVTSIRKGAWLVKADIQEAYRMIPIHLSISFRYGLGRSSLHRQEIAIRTIILYMIHPKDM